MPRRALPPALIRQLVDEAVDLSFTHLFLTGGEPFLLPDVQAAAPATPLAAEPHTAAMQLASRLDLLPLALELLRLNGETGAITGTVRDTACKPVAQALVTIGGCAVVCHTSFSTGQRISDLQMIVPDVSSRPFTLLLDTWHNGWWTLGYARW